MLGLSISMACHFLASPNIFGIPEVSSRAAAPEEKSLIFSTISLLSLSLLFCLLCLSPAAIVFLILLFSLQIFVMQLVVHLIYARN